MSDTVTTGSIRTPAIIRGRDPLILVPGGPARPWPPSDGRFADAPRRTLAFAQDEAVRLNHNHLGPVHILVGLVREEPGLAARVLAELSATPDRTRDALESTLGRSEAGVPASEITLIPRSQNVLDKAIYEARRLAHPRVDTEHLLLGVIDEGDDFTLRVFAALAIDRSDVRAELFRRMHVPPSYGLAENATPQQGPYDVFDDTSRRVIEFSQGEALRLGRHWVGAEHFVLGLARAAELDETSRLGRVFEALALSLERARAEVAAIQPPRTATAGREMTFTRATKLVIELAIYEAGAGQTVHPEHLLLAIGDAQDEFLGGYALKKLGATPERVRAILTTL